MQNAQSNKTNILLAKLKMAEERAEREGWVDAEVLERELGLIEFNRVVCVTFEKRRRLYLGKVP